MKKMNASVTKIIFFDIDGTLLKLGHKELSPQLKETLIKLQQNGIKICLATGRSLVTIPVFDNIEFDAIIAFNGSYCYTKDQVIYKNPISKEAVHRIIDNATSISRPVALATIETIGANGIDDDLEAYFNIAHESVPLHADFDSFKNHEIYQIMSGARNHEYEYLLEGVDGAEITAWWHRAVDIIPANGSKAVGIQKTLEFFGINREDSIAFGDGNNDIPMLQAVGKGIAMGNASEELKEIADEVCDSVENDGIYKYCIDNHLI